MGAQSLTHRHDVQAPPHARSAVDELAPVLVPTIGSSVVAAGRPSSRGVGPAGVGTLVSRSSRWSRAALTVLDGGLLVVGGVLELSMRCRCSFGSSS